VKEAGKKTSRQKAGKQARIHQAGTPAERQFKVAILCGQAIHKQFG